MMFVVKTSLFLLFLLVLSHDGSCKQNPKSETANRNANVSANKTDSNIRTDKMSSDDVQKQEPASDDTWGGNHVRLTMKPNGAELEFDCAHGEINQSLKADSEGHFDLEGTFVREGGPVRVDEPAKGQQVRYVGEISGNAMSFQIHFQNSKEPTEPFKLTRGSSGRLWKCR